VADKRGIGCMAVVLIVIGVGAYLKLDERSRRNEELAERLEQSQRELATTQQQLAENVRERASREFPVVTNTYLWYGRETSAGKIDNVGTEVKSKKFKADQLEAIYGEVEVQNNLATFQDNRGRFTFKIVYPHGATVTSEPMEVSIPKEHNYHMLSFHASHHGTRGTHRLEFYWNDRKCGEAAFDVEE
jgi:hypothetical protein